MKKPIIIIIIAALGIAFAVWNKTAQRRAYLEGYQHGKQGIRKEPIPQLTKGSYFRGESDGKANRQPTP